MENDSEILIKAKKVIAFFDLFDYPLTAFEIWEYLTGQVKLEEIIDILDKGVPVLSQKNGLYFLTGRDEITAIRAQHYNYSNRKYKSARKFVGLFKWLPFIKVIALANSIGAHNLRDGSDIDIFVISAPRRIWLTRFVLASAAKLLNRRPTSKNKRDKICLSFYITTENLNLDNLMLPDGDPYFNYWLQTLVLLYNKDSVYEKFLVANRLAPDSSIVDMKNIVYAPKNIILDQLELLLKKIQLIIMSPALKQAMNNSAGVVVNDQVLKLYLRDNRQEYAEKYGNKIRQIFTKID